MATQTEQTSSQTPAHQQESSEPALFRTVFIPDSSLEFSGFGPHELLRFSPFSFMRWIAGDFDRFALASGRGRAGRNKSSWSPAIEVTEKGGAYRVEAELPGMAPDDVKVEVTKDAIIIRGERRTGHEGTSDETRRTERRYGPFYRAIPVPEGADTDQAKATFRNGLLEITVPVPGNVARPIPIVAEGGTSAEQQKQAA
jgi:HSP20 family protein